MAIHAQAHSHAHGATGAVLRRAFLLTLVILVVEVIGGVISHSLALLSDAGPGSPRIAPKNHPTRAILMAITARAFWWH
jgi:hypothetical protein